MTQLHVGGTLVDNPDPENAKLPPILRHDDIHETRDVGAAVGDMQRHAYQIVFDRTFLPYAYARNICRAGWEIEYSRIEHHNTRDGLLGLFMPKQACITIVVAKETEGKLFGGETA
jgi:hypothetical protein